MVFLYCFFSIHNNLQINKMKQGDKVTCTTHPGEWTLVWYKEGDNTCAIQNDKYRYIVKTATLKLVK
jgi:hypothetical protein